MISVEKVLRSKNCWILCGFLVLAASLILAVWEPSDRPEHSICFFRQATEISCPGCGLTRGFAALLKFDFSGAIQKHPLSPWFAFEAFILWSWWGFIAARRISMPSSIVLNRLLALQAGLLVMVWVYRISEGILPT